VAPDAATVDFVRASLGDTGGGRQEKEANGAVVASYRLNPRQISTPDSNVSTTPGFR